MKKRAVIIGGTGLIGRSLTEELKKKGYHVVATGISHGKETAGDAVTLVEWDGLNTEKLVTYLEGADAVINLAGSPVKQKWTEKGKDNILRSRIESGSALAASIRKTKKKPGVIIQASATSYYGDSDEVVTEESKAGKTWLAYVCTHWEGATESVERTKVRRCVVRIAPVLANKGYLAQRARPFKTFLGGYVGREDRWLSWISLKDATKAIVFLIENKKTRGTYNLSSPAPVQEKHFAKALAETLRRPCWLRTPEWLLRTRFTEEQVKELITPSNRAEPQRLLKEGFKFSQIDIEGALESTLKND